jgi:hypothetical protein
VAKPDLIAKAGIRRTINAGIVFWQREHFLDIRESQMAYKALLPKHRYYHSIFEEWIEFESEMYEKEKNLLEIDSILSSEHFDLLFDDA